MIDLEKLREQAPYVGLIDVELIELLDHIAQLEKVAGRYKWLRQSPSPACDIAMAKHFSCGRGEDFESLIDTAMEAKHG